MRSVLLLITITGLLSQLAAAQSSSVQQQRNLGDEAIAAVRQESQADFPLRATWVPELGDDVIFLKTQGRLSLGTRVAPISFYRVTAAPYELRGNQIERQTVDLDKYDEWLVAIDQESGEKYLLRGSRNPAAEFNRLMRRLQVRVSDGGAALGVFDLFLKAVEGEQVRSRVVGDRMKLQSVALEDFRLRFPAAQSRTAFSAWWKRIPTAELLALKPPQAQAVERGFAVRYTLYDQGSLRKETLKINADCTVARIAPECATNPQWCDSVRRRN